jgi:hypothetical protein
MTKLPTCVSGRPIKGWLTKINSPRHLISRLLRTRHTAVAGIERDLQALFFEEEVVKLLGIPHAVVLFRFFCSVSAGLLRGDPCCRTGS